jgi:hypothetical protein
LIEPSESPWSSPVVLIKKKDGSHRFCVDFRHLNSDTIRDAYPLPRADEQLEALGNARYFSSLDLASGFWQIEMDQNDKEKTAFCVPNGLYQFKVMPMGLTNAPLTFQRMMDQILKHLNWKKCLCFFDDILIFSSTFDEHLIALDEVLSTLARANLKVKYSKCQFALNEITFLGHRITQEGICPDPAKVSSLVNIKEPTNITEVKSFIGLASYYRKYVKNFSEIALPLLNLTRKNVKFDWTINCQNAFEKLKQLLVNPPVLTLPDFNKHFIIQSDASKKAFGAILSQQTEDGEKPIAYASRTTTDSETRYNATELELAAIAWGLNHFHQYINGRKVNIVTDHKPLAALQKIHAPSSRIANLLFKIQQYGSQITYKSGKQHSNADALSRPEIKSFSIHTTNYKEIQQV